MSDLQAIVTLIKAGEKNKARRMLIDLLRADPDNEKAWLCMASCATTRQQLETSIHNILRVNPQNETALRLARRHNILLPLPPERPVVSGPSPAAPEGSPATLPSQPMVVLKSQAMVEALATLNEVLSEPQLRAKPQTAKEKAGTPAEPEATLLPPTMLRRLRYIALASVMVILLLLLGVLARDEWQTTNEAATLTAIYIDAASTRIVQTNAAIEATQSRRATQFTGTETAYSATDTARVRTAIARLHHLKEIYPASITNEEIPEIEKRDSFLIGELVYIVVEIDEGRDTFNVQAQILIQGNNIETVFVIQEQTIVQEPADQQVIFIFNSNTWVIGTYRARVAVDGEAGISTTFTLRGTR